MTKAKKKIVSTSVKIPVAASDDYEDGVAAAAAAAEEDSSDEIHMSLAPYIQTYLAHSNSRTCCGCLPVPFERAAPHSWILPSFDSDILEKQFKISSLKQFKIRFRFALVYMMILSASWLIFLLSQSRLETVKFEYVIFAQAFLFSIWIFFLTYKDVYKFRDSMIGGITAIHLVVTCLMFAFASGTSMISHFTLPCCSIFAIYTVFPLPPYLSLVICVLFSITFEIILFTVQKQFAFFHYGFAIRILCQVCVHIIGFHILVMTHVRVRGTFMKVGQRLLVQKQLEMEKRLKENIIHSVMPPKVADWLLGGERGENPRPSNHEDLGSLFRPFNMNRMDNVSILFADIVGFTRMSSNKTAEEIVDILNDLFERFDDLCLANGCEKISTLGDCYYCVSGCPEPRTDHAKCCVEMGLDMIDAIQEFDVDRGEDVNMRVGVHTGTVLCGIVGTRRFKFDVWSNDVSFANKLESTGLPGRVHISEKTAHYLKDAYALEDHEDLLGIKTYLIKARVQPVRRREIKSTELSNLFQRNNFVHNRKTINLSHSCTKKSHYLSLLTEARSKFTSLPNVLGSNRGLTSSLEKLNYSQWFSFAKLKKNSMSDVTSGKQTNQRIFASGGVKQDGSAATEEIESRPKAEEEISLCPSTANRNSVLRNGNRRSSIQQQIFLMSNGLGQREEAVKKLSSHHDSSISTLSPLESESECEAVVRRPRVMDTLSLGFYSLRKQSDLQLIKCIKDISKSGYIVKVPIDQFTLFFKDRAAEKEYRANVHKIHEKIGDSPTTLSTTRFNTYFDVFVSALVLICTILSVYLLNDVNPHFAAVSTVALLVEFLALALCVVHLAKTAKNKSGNAAPSDSIIWRNIYNLFSKWYPWHLFGGMLVSLPTIIVLFDFGLRCSGFAGENTSSGQNITFEYLLASEDNRKLGESVIVKDQYHSLLVLVGLFHFCNFTQLNFFVKSAFALATGLAYLILFARGTCSCLNDESVIFMSRFLQRNVFANQSTEVSRQKIHLPCQTAEDALERLYRAPPDSRSYYDLGLQFLDSYYSDGGGNSEGISDGVYFATEDARRFLSDLNRSLVGVSSKSEWLKTILAKINRQLLISRFSETVLDVILIIFLVLVLNREFEISYRLSYHCNAESNRDKMRVQNMKNQADWLLENIIPKYVSSELKNRAKYCKTHSNVGVMFASLVNFNKLYDETYSGGKEYLRVLNELISDFDELLNSDRFRNVEKIKTIGSTFMGASGLDPIPRKKNATDRDHIYELMDFALEMYRVVDVFNQDLLGFNLVLRVGFNVGEVTAGVIGSSKLFYDIWGDAVNVASRMDSCGVDGRIQVPESCASVLSIRYGLEPRGQIFVKGKGDIMVYLIKSSC